MVKRLFHIPYAGFLACLALVGLVEIYYLGSKTCSILLHHHIPTFAGGGGGLQQEEVEEFRLIPSREDTKENSISLVVSFWAENEDRQQNPHAHCQEVEAAMLTNLQNPHLDQLVVVLDSVSEGTTNCQTFIDHMAQRFHNITQGVLPSQSGSTLRSFLSKKEEKEEKQFPFYPNWHVSNVDRVNRIILKCFTMRRIIRR